MQMKRCFDEYCSPGAGVSVEYRVMSAVSPGRINTRLIREYKYFQESFNPFFAMQLELVLYERTDLMSRKMILGF